MRLSIKGAGAQPVYREKVSGARADRPQLAKLMASLKPGDVVVVTKLDRLGRSTRELLDLIERIGKAGASFRSLGDPLWDTSRAPAHRAKVQAKFDNDCVVRPDTLDGRTSCSTTINTLSSAGVGDAPDRPCGVIRDQQRSVGGNRQRCRPAPHFRPALA